MTKSYPTKLDADYTPNDIGPPERVGLNKPMTEAERENYYLKLSEMEDDARIY